ncbi:hypothetical protein [Psychrobacter pygoscelis]|uniref:hypothetical protein n=1 Tax=Psychrobacter pygoscelis TaxID=2488563 RepID=UPI001039BE00|nr:hypothetical protein [Psychrobacter pygoscelis]
MNTLFKSLSIALLSISTMLASMSATAYDPQDRAIIEDKVQLIVDSMERMDFAPIFAMMPSKVYDYFAESTGMSVDDIKQLMMAQSQQVFAGMSEDMVFTYLVDLDNAKVRQSEIGRDYLIIPTKLDMMNDGMGIVMQGNMVAFEDDGKWFLMRIANQQHLDIIADIYPDLYDLELFEATTNVYDPEEMTE